MAGRATRGNQDLNNLRELVGSSSPLPQTDLPSLRDLLRAGIYLKEVSLTGPKQISNYDLSKELTDLLISVYRKANIQFEPGQNLQSNKAIREKIEKVWKDAVFVANNTGKGLKQKKEVLMDKMDKMFKVLYCQCSNIRSCEENNCNSDCTKQAHIDCTCPKDRKIPVIELLFIRDQRNRDRKGLMIGGKDDKESKRLEKMLKRKAEEEASLRERWEISQQEEEVNNNQFGAEDVLEDDDNNNEDVDVDPDFSLALKKKSSQNRIKLDNLARESLRGGVSVRKTAQLATALLIDLKLVSKEEAHLIVDHHKVQRARDKVMEELRDEAEKDVEESELMCIFFDGRKDKTKVIVEDEEGDEFARTQFEEHYTLTDPHKYLTHFTPDEGSGAKGVATKVVEFLSDAKQLENVKVVGGDSTSPNTGWKEGAIHHIETGKGEKVLWDICMLHTNELPLRHLMKNLGMETTGANTFSGVLGQLVKDDVHEFEVNENFEKLEFATDLRELPDYIVADLSTDQKYMYKITRMIITGHLQINILKQVVGPVNHSRWLTTACRLCRIWVSNHGLRKNSKAFTSLKKIVSFIVSVYVPMWFEVKCKPNICHGPDHVLTAVGLVEKYCSPEIKEVVHPVMQRGAWHAHTENILLNMIGSDNLSKREFAIDKIKEIRQGQEFGNSAVRDFHVPTINFAADSLFNLIDWSEEVLEPVVTCSIPTNQLDQYIQHPYPKLDIECHTQSCERAVKETTIAASKVFGFERRDGLIRATLKSRMLVSSVKSKKSLAGMLG